MIAVYIVFLISIAGIGLSFIGYPAAIRFMARNRSHSKSPKLEHVTVIVPARNEEAYLKRKIENIIASEYPESLLEVLVVESGSDDRTVEIARNLPVRLIHSDEGKVRAINEGVRHARSDIIVVTDADTLTDASSIKNLVKHLYGRIGAVSGYSHLNESSERGGFYLKSKLKYDRAEWKLRHAEGLVDSARNLDGKLMAFRKSVVPALPVKFLCDDFPLTLVTRKLGYRCVIAADAHVYEEVPARLTEELKQIRRRMGLGIRVGLHYSPSMAFNPRYSIFGMLTVPFRILTPIFLPFILVYIALYLFVAMSWYYGAGLLGGGLLAVIALRGPYPLLQLLGTVLAWVDIISGKTGKAKTWEKIVNKDRQDHRNSN
ncbi:MAG: glycosyltransferase [Dehalococcoidia bacterium]